MMCNTASLFFVRDPFVFVSVGAFFYFCTGAFVHFNIGIRCSDHGKNYTEK